MNSPEQAHQERDRLSALLRQWRVRAGLTSSAAAGHAGFSQSKLSKIENGLLLPSEADVRALCRTYRVTATKRAEAVRLLGRLKNEIDSARVILQRGAYRKQQQIGRVEAETTHFRDFHPAYVIGLLQTPAYMRRIFASLPAADAAQALRARTARQQVLLDDTKQFNLVMTEGALRWRAGPPEMMIAQIDRIAEVATLPNVRVGVISWTTEVDTFPGHAFHMYDDRLVIVGTVSATATIQDPRDIALYTKLFAELAALASYGVDADRTLRRIRREYQRLS
jgi:transcriptional regulator with XRE-family HTH domain